MKIVKEKRLCFRCFSPDHLSSTCEKTEECGKEGCRGRHHSLLHGAPRGYSKPPSTIPAEASATNTVSSSAIVLPFIGKTATLNNESVTLLPIFPILVKNGDMSVRVLAFLDPGSEITFINEKTASQLGLSGPKESLKINTVNGPGGSTPTRRVSFSIESIEEGHSFEIVSAYTRSSLPINQRQVQLSEIIKNWRHLLDIPLKSPGQEEVSILIGSDHPAVHEILEYRADPEKSRAPRAIRTHFGWCVIGPVEGHEGRKDGSCNRIAVITEKLSEVVNKFFHEESFGTKPGVQLPVGKEEKITLNVLTNTTRHDGTRYECGLLLRDQKLQLPDNKD